MPTVFSTENMNIQQAFIREHYEGYDTLLAGMTKANDFLRVAAVLPSNHGAVHNTLVADKLPSGAVRNANQGIASLSANSHLKKDPIVSFEGLAQVDVNVIDAAPDPGKARQSEDAMCLEGFSQSWNDFLLKGDPAKDGGFEGLYARRNKLGENCISLGGTGSNLSSAFLIEMGETAFALRYAPGIGPGLHYEDKGLVWERDPDGKKYETWASHYQIAYGISIRQEAALKRICNIDPDKVTATNLIKKVIVAKNKLPHAGKNAFLFVNADIQSLIEIACIEGAKSLTIKDIEGFGPTPYFLNLPILRMDALLANETAIA